MIITVDTSDPDLTKPYEPKVVPPGSHLFVVSKPVKATKAKGTDNTVVKVTLSCQDEGEMKGAIVFDNIVFIKDPQTEGQRKSVKINQGKLVQLAISLGVTTESEVKNGNGEIDLDLFEGNVCSAITKVVQNEYPLGSKNFTPQADIVRYTFEPETEVSAA